MPAVSNAPRRSHLGFEDLSDPLAQTEPIWEDYKVGVGHCLRGERIAVVTDVEWIRDSVRALSFLMPGAVRVFVLADADKAREWIVAADAR